MAKKTWKKIGEPEIVYCPVCGYETEGVLVEGTYTCEVCGRKFRSGHDFFNRKTKSNNEDGKD